ncbi:MAG: signal peptidase II [Gemmatimonadota bacterium]
MRTKLTLFFSVFIPVMALDILTKRWALTELAGKRGELFGGLVPLTLAFNKGAAFGMRVGEDSRWLFVPITLVALVLLFTLFRQAHARDYLRLTALSLVISGALGNLYDRLRWGRGVVDFIGPVDLGFWDFPIFNVADIAITCGAILLALSFWMEERAEARSGGAVATADPAPSGAEPPST